MGAPLIELLTPGTVVLAAGQRLCRHLAQQYARECRERGQDVWETPAILTLGAWLGSLWQGAVETGADRRLLLVPAQEAALWERIIADSPSEAQLLSATATAGLAADAWTLMHAWRLPRADIARAGHEDVQAFVTWATAFDETCRVNRWLDNASLPDALVELIEKRRIAVPARLLLAGFDELTPQQTRLMDALRAAGCVVAMVGDSLTSARSLREKGSGEGKIASAVRVPLPSVDDEILAAARWTRALLDQSPSMRIGILAPDLAAQGHTLRRVFDDVLLPQAILPGHEEVTRPYNISFGEPLAAQPLVSAGLAILDVARGSFPLSQLTALLCSPFLVGGDVEMGQRAALDVELRSIGDVEIDLDALAAALRRRDDCPILVQRLARFRELAATLPRTQRPSRWIALFAQLLAGLGWPGDRSRTSTEHQIVEAWRKLLSKFGALDAVVPPLRYVEALARLRRMAQETLFQRETPETPVQILGVFEASGFEFDALWAMGLHDEVWPAASRPNPFLPIALQRQHRVPHASAERELEFCSRLTQRLLRSAPEVVLSHPLREEDRDLRPSPLIRGMPEVPASEIAATSSPRFRDVVHAASMQESLVDQRAPVLEAGAMVHGGTALFRAQSACPFRAFAEYRLRAKDFPEPEPGLDPRERGNLVHDVLAQVWQELGSHARLIGMGQDELSARVAVIAGAVVDRLARRRPATMTDRMTVLEQRRLTSLILEWLELERARAPFVVRREETKVNMRVGELRTDARMDRVDQLADGNFVIIDYKTGEPRTLDWFGERPAEPQLPLYALYGMPRDRVVAMLYGKVRRGESKFVGIAREADIAPRVEAYAASRLAAQQGPWQTLFEKWETRLTALSEEHRSGVARVSPRDKQVCEHCHLHALCRIHERRARLVDVGEGSDE